MQRSAVGISNQSTILRAVLKVLPFISAVALSACGDCGGDPGRIEQKQGDQLQFEAISLGIGKEAFIKQALSVAELENVDITAQNACSDQLDLAVPDIDDDRIVDRRKGRHRLTNCVVRTNLASKTTALLELKGEFVDNRLVRLTFRLRPDAFNQLKASVERRFGKGAVMSLTEQLIIEEKAVAYQIWQEPGEIWLLSKGETGTVLFVHQDLKTSETLPEPSEAAERGEPVSLEDLGIGKLDLNAPMPELNLPDSGLKNDKN